MEYIACGNLMLDRIENKNGEPGALNIGGFALFALSGIRLWTENCKVACRVGADYGSYFGPWMERNNIPQENISVEVEHNIQHIVKRRDHQAIHWLPVYGAEHRGYLLITPEHIDAATDYDTKGIFLNQSEDKIFWQKLYDIKTRKGFKVLWEFSSYNKIERPAEMLRRILDIMPMTDMWSISIAEASRLFGIPQRDEDAIIDEIMKLPIELTLLRLGNNGSWAVTPTTAAHCDAIDVPETIDPLGCGSTASGAALYAHCEGFSPAMVATMANVAAGHTAAQLGPAPHLTPEVMQRAQALAKQQYKKTIVRKKQA